MRENDYTGVPMDDSDELALSEDLRLFEVDIDKDVVAFGAVDGENEMLLHIGAAANGARSLRAAAERLYDYAEELLTLSAENWELVDDVSNGHGTAVRFDQDDELGSDNG